MTDPQQKKPLLPLRGADKRPRKSVSHEERVKLHAQALEMYASGMQRGDISKALGYSESWFSHTARENSMFRAEVDRIDVRRLTARGKTAPAAPAAIQSNVSRGTLDTPPSAPPGTAVAPAAGSPATRQQPSGSLADELRARRDGSRIVVEQLDQQIQRAQAHRVKLLDEIAALDVAITAVETVS